MSRRHTLAPGAAEQPRARRRGFNWRRVLVVVAVLVTLRLALTIAFRSPTMTSWIRHFNKRITNRLALTPLGRRIYAVVHHVGRRSGKAYATPVIIARFNSGFYIPVSYGVGSDWIRNVQAAGRCTIEWHGVHYPVEAPEIVDAAEALPAFPRFWRTRLSGLGITRFIKLHHVPIAEHAGQAAGIGAVEPAAPQ